MVISSSTMYLQKSLIMSSSSLKGWSSLALGAAVMSVGIAQLSLPAIAGLVVGKGALHEAQISVCSEGGGVLIEVEKSASDSVQLELPEISNPLQLYCSTALEIVTVLKSVTGVPVSIWDILVDEIQEVV